MSMKERPILFSAPMVRAILDGRKTQTRRAVKGNPSSVLWDPIVRNGYGGWRDEHGRPVPCRYGKPGDRLWVRETWQHSNFPLGPYQDGCAVFYRADYLDDPHGPDGEKSPEGKYRTWAPSIHMPRRGSRIQLDITDVRCERLQDISHEDAIAEGLKGLTKDGRTIQAGRGTTGCSTPVSHIDDSGEQINGAGSWEANPFVWVVEFRRVAPC